MSSRLSTLVNLHLDTGKSIVYMRGGEGQWRQITDEINRHSINSKTEIKLNILCQRTLFPFFNSPHFDGDLVGLFYLCRRLFCGIETLFNVQR